MDKRRGVIFDLDGTLLDTLGDLTAAVNYALAAHGYPPRTTAQVRQFVGDGVQWLIRRACPPACDEGAVAQVLETYLPYYARHSLDTTGPYPGIPALLSTLRAAGFAMAIVSNKQEQDVEALRQRFFADTVALAMGGSATLPLKPAPDSTLLALQRLGAAPEDAWFVGDGETDVRTARNAGLRCVAVTWGFRDPEQLRAAGAEILVDTPQQAAAYLLG